MVAGSGASFFDEGPPDATQSLWQVRALDFQGMGKSSAMGQEPTHTIRPASCRCRPIAASFHRLFLGGLLPSRARFRFAGYAHGIRSILSRQAHANSHTERSPLDSAHISCRLAAPKSAGAGQTDNSAAGELLCGSTRNGSVCSKLLKLKAYSWSKLLTSELLFVVSHAEQHLAGRNGLQDHRCNQCSPTAETYS